jgi:protein TonB
MARRRRAKNNLLAKMIGVAVLINAILLPILATLGVFKPKKGFHLMEVKLVKLPPPKKIVQKKQQKKVAKAKPKPTVGHHPQTHVAQNRPSPPNPNQPHVMATNTGNGPAIENNGTATPGQVTTQPTPVTTPPVAQTTPPPTPAPAPQPTPVPEVKPTPPPPTPPAPVYAEAEPLTQPQPDVPDDLAGQELHTTFWGLFTIHPDGTTDVKMVKSTGNSELDDAALDAARKWTFKPGTKDGSPVESYRRLRIDIDVS